MMHRIPHPGEFIREICLEPLDITVTEAARKLGVTRKALLNYSMEKRVSALKWRCAWLKRLIPHQKVG